MMAGSVCGRVACRLVMAVCLVVHAGAQESGGDGPPKDRDLAPQAPAEPAPMPVLDVEEARAALELTLDWLKTNQNEDGSWGTHVPGDLYELGFAWDTYYAWQVASCALAVMALRAAPPTPEIEASLAKGIEWLTTTRVPHRGANWDVDSTWASLYGFVALVELARDPRFAEGELADKIRQRGLAWYADLERRQTPDGGWAYYDDPPFTERPKWATSFCTALILPPLLDALELGWPIDPEVPRRAQRMVERCALPNGAYAYDFRLRQRAHGGESINAVPGSLARIQVANWALWLAGEERVDDGAVRKGLEQFFEEHLWLDLARTRPIPHEGWFANAGYFYFFGHYYAAKAISLLPEAEREAWHRPLRHHVEKTLTGDGSTTDFLIASYQITAGTSYAALILAEGLSGSSLDHPRGTKPVPLPAPAPVAAEAEEEEE